MINISFFKKLTAALVAVIFVSCDKDYNTIGSDIVGNENFDFMLKPCEVQTFNKKVPVVQTNNLPINQLGILKSDVFGTTKANFVTQLSLSEFKPKFTSHVTMDSVVLSVPFFSRKKKTEANGHGLYELDSVYSSDINSPLVYEPINLQIYRNGKELHNYNPEDLNSGNQLFSNQDADFAGKIVGSSLNNDPNPNQNTSFKPSASEIIIKKRDASFNFTADVESRSKPAMRLRLNKTVFDADILQKAVTEDENLVDNGMFFNNANFKDNFFGLYFQVQDATTGSLMSMDFAKGNVTIYYHQDKVKGVAGATEMKSMVLNMTGNTVNLFANSGVAAEYNSSDNDDDIEDDDLFLKGGQGSMAFIKLFPDQADIDFFKKNKMLINDASLTFTVKKIPGKENRNPDRIYIYNADDKTPVFDYYFDNSINSTNSKRNKYLHGGLRVTESNGEVTYRIRITDHVARVLNEKITAERPFSKINANLGIVVTENINSVLNANFKNNLLFGTTSFKTLPVASVMSPLGVVLYGSKILVSEAGYDKRAKLEIYYTKPN